MGIVQESCDKMRVLRRRIDSVRSAIDEEMKSPSSRPIAHKHVQNVYTALSNTKMRLGNTLDELSNMPSPYEKARNRRKNGSEEIPEEEHKGTLDIGAEDTVSLLDKSRDSLKQIAKEIKDIHNELTCLPPEIFVFTNLESAYVSCKTARNWIGMMLGDIRDDRSS